MCTEHSEVPNKKDRYKINGIKEKRWQVQYNIVIWSKQIMR